MRRSQVVMMIVAGAAIWAVSIHSLLQPARLQSVLGLFSLCR